MSLLVRTTSSSLIAIAASFGAIALPTHAFTITPNDAFDDLLDVLLGDTTGLSNFTGSVSGAPEAFGTFENDPFGLETGIVLSTGRVVDIPGQNNRDDFLTPESEPGGGVDLNASLGVAGFEPNTFDTATIEISFDADATVEQLFFQYVFGSEEFLEYAGSEFNDFFTLTLNGSNLALLGDSVGNDSFVRVNNLAANASGPFSSEYVNNPAGSNIPTKLDGFTQPLIFQGDVVSGNNILQIQISDVSDSVIDSAVFIQGGTLGITEPPAPPPIPMPSEPPVAPPGPSVSPEPVETPESSTFVGLLLLALSGMGASLQSNRRG